MKYACDVCEKVATENEIREWLLVKTEYFSYRFCDKCQKKFWNIFKKEKPEQKQIDNLKETYEQIKEKLGFNDTDMIIILALAIAGPENVEKMTEKYKQKEIICNCTKE